MSSLQLKPNRQHSMNQIQPVKKHLLDFEDDHLEGVISENAEKSYRKSQIRKWIFEDRAESFSDMLNLSKGFRETLSDHYQVWTSTQENHLKSSDGTEKLLLKWPDGGLVECVLLRDGIRRSICVSSQVGMVFH